MRRVQELGGSARVEVRVVGATQEGRPIPLLAVSSAENIAKLETIRHQHLAGPPPTGRPVPVPVLFLANDHGSEASQVQALLELAEELASDDAPETGAALRSVIVLIMPVVSPDGYERSRREWTNHPLSSGRSGDGNHYGIGVTREYLHSDEPETSAVKSVICDWQPLLVWEVQEDGASLGRTHTEVAVAPPLRVVDPGAAPTARAEQRVGAAIAAAWRAAGYDVLHEPTGRHAWSFAGDNAARVAPEAGLRAAMALSGVVAVQTVSARSPGTQSWEDRNQQKRIAGRAILMHVAGDAGEDLVRTRVDVLRRALDHDAAGRYLIPTDQDPAVVRHAVSLLEGAGVHVEHPTDPGGTLVVPRRQALKGLADLLLSPQRGGDGSLVIAMGLVVHERGDGQGESERSPAGPPARGADSAAPDGARRLAGTPSGPETVTFSGSGAMAAVNRLLRTPGVRVGWLAGGDFVASVPPAEHHVVEMVRAVALETINESSIHGAGMGYLARSPRVGVYAGPGVRDAGRAGGLGRVRWYLRDGEFPATLLRASDIVSGALDDVDVLIVPAGDVREILRGWSDDDLLRRFPWDSPGDDGGLAGDGVSAIRSFIDAGGTFIGIDAGGGWLATRDHAHLLDVGADDLRPDVSMATVRPDATGRVLFAGLGDSVRVPAGTAFVHPPSVRRLAGYSSGVAVDAAAIIEGHAGAGRVVLFGFDPTHRLIARRSARLLGNAILRAVATWDGFDDRATPQT
ncbi:M14 family zinc carboxypeptidase [Jiangella aurantiaca]|nr:M14 family zinc carboxypeptidase [Jiangella aurantiaca]